VDDDEPGRPGAEHADLRRRVEEAEAVIEELRAEAIARRAEVRALAESLPAAMSRRVVLRAMVVDVYHHPDKVGAAKGAARRLGRGGRKALRAAVRPVRQWQRRLAR
jgi:hypothetical protein